MYKKLAIYDRDMEYLRHLAEYLKSKAPGLFQIKLFTKEEALKEFLQGEMADILLLTEEMPEAKEMAVYCGHLVLLTQAPMTEKKPSVHTIYKYQPGEAILKELRELLPQDAVRNTGRDTLEKEVISVISLNPGKLSQGFSLSLWNEKCKEKKTLFITLLAYPFLEELRIQEGETGLSEFIYYLKQNSPGLLRKGKEYVSVKESFEYMKGVSFGADLYELTAEDVNNWFTLLSQWEYDTVLFDIGIFTQASIRVLQESSVIYLISEEDRLSEEQLANFFLQLKWAGYEAVTEKTVIIRAGREKAGMYEERLLKGL